MFSYLFFFSHNRLLRYNVSLHCINSKPFAKKKQQQKIRKKKRRICNEAEQICLNICISGNLVLILTLVLVRIRICRVHIWNGAEIASCEFRIVRSDLFVCFPISISILPIVSINEKLCAIRKIQDSENPFFVALTIL